jgi:DNA-binding beta-propeller fold protein YncE
MSRIRHSPSVFITVLLTGVATLIGQEKGGGDETGAYEVVAGWLKPLPDHEAWVPASVTAVFAESPDRVFVIQRGELPLPEGMKPGPLALFAAPGRTATSAVSRARREHYILVADRNGTVVDTWTQWDKLWDGSRGPHHIKINPYDPERHVWIIDDDLQQVLKFTNDGKQLVMTLGERLVPANDRSHFGRPTDIAWLPDGTFFVTDGYINSRVVKFDRDGKFLMTWGADGSGPGQFMPSVHAVAIDNDRRLYVADRGNSRIQVFDENGRFLDAWPNIRDPWHVHVATDQSIWVADGATNKFLKFDKAGRLLYSWGTFGQFPGALWGVHQFSVDQEGNLYTAEAFNGRVEKFRPKPGADPAKVIPPERALPVRAEPSQGGRQ